MALGQAAGVAASIAVRDGARLRDVDIGDLQQRLIRQGAVLIYFEDVGPDDEPFEALEFFALRGFLRASEWKANLEEPVDPNTAAEWIKWTGLQTARAYAPGLTTRGELLSALYTEVMNKSPEFRQKIRGNATETVR
jgi:hypothetical protein